jgi:hypothetical protein
MKPYKFFNSTYMDHYLDLLDRVIGDAKTLSRTEFENKYKGKVIPIILNAPCVFNDSTYLFRGRLAKDVDMKEDMSSPATFSYVPLFLNKIGKPKMGRANYEGQSIFYASEHMKTNFKEISKESNIDDEAYMAKWRIKPNSNMHLYRTTPAWGISTTNDAHSTFTITDPCIVNGELGLYLKRLGYIMMSDEEVGKYLGSSFIANCIYSINVPAKEDAGNDTGFHYDGIAYPSVAAGGTEEVNIALKPEFVDKHLELECVIKGRLAPDMRSVKYEKIGINEGGRIVWYSSFIDESSIIDVVPTYFDTTGCCVDLAGGTILDADDKVVSSEMVPFTQALNFHRDELFNGLAEFMNTQVKENQIDNIAALDKTVRIGVIREFSGWKLVNGDQTILLSRVLFSITLKNQLRKLTLEEVR